MLTKQYEISPAFGKLMLKVAIATLVAASGPPVAARSFSTERLRHQLHQLQTAAVWSTNASALAAALPAELTGSGKLGDRPPMQPLPDFPKNPIGDSKGIGYLPGSAGVSASGRATYSIPLAIPAGVAGMQPELSLHYASGGHNGALGIGWTLNGTSQITRCHKTLRTDGVTAGIEFKDTDAFCLNGEKLISVAHPAETWPEYRTEANPFDRIVHDLAANEFKVWDSAGRIATYGFSWGWQSQVVDPNAQGNPEPDVLGIEPWRVHLEYPDHTVTAEWLLRQLEDRSGNAIQYHYGCDGLIGDPDPHSPDEVCLHDITYTHGGSAKANRSVIFDWEPRDDEEFTYSAGVKHARTQRLKRISMYAPALPGDNDGVLQWEYRLAYEYSPLSGRSELDKVQQCDAKGVCAWAKQFHWMHPQNEQLSVSATISNLTPPVVASTSCEFPGAVDRPILMDADGDGKTDILAFDTTAAGPQCGKVDIVQDQSHIPEFQWRLWTSSDGLMHNVSSPSGPFWDSARLVPERVRVVDIDADGQDELFVGLDQADGDPINSWYFNGSGTFRYGCYRFFGDASSGTYKFVPCMPTEQKDSSNSSSFTTRWFLAEQIRWPLWNFVDVFGEGRPQLIEGTQLRRNLGNFPNGQVNLEPTQRPTDLIDLDDAPNHEIAWLWNLYNLDATGLDIDGDGRSDLLLTYNDQGFSEDIAYDPAGNMHTVKIPNAEPNLKTLSWDANSVQHLEHVMGTAKGSIPYADKVTRRNGDEILTEHSEAYWISVYADVNGDGLKDQILISVSQSDHDFVPGGSYIQWNTGKGFTQTEPTDVQIVPPDLSAKIDPQTGEKIGGLRDEFFPSSISVVDINHDGRDDLIVKSVVALATPNQDVSYLPKHTRAYISNGRGFTVIEQPFDPGDYMDHSGYSYALPGNFDANGNAQFVRLKDGKLEKVDLDVGPPELIDSVQDEGADHDREMFQYKYWSQYKPSGAATCNYPIICPSEMGWVVDQLWTSHGQDKDGKLIYRRMKYEYDEDLLANDFSSPGFHSPRIDRRGRGFLGFESIAATDLDSGAITKTYYGVPQLQGEFYPYVGIAQTQTTYVPVFDEPDNGTGNLKAGKVKVRVSKTESTPQVKWLYGGKAYFSYVKQSIAQVYEQDMSLSLPGGIPRLDSPQGAQDLLSYVTQTTDAVDDFGHGLSGSTSIQGGETRSWTAMYDNNVCYTGAPGCSQGWLIGRKKSESVSSLGITRKSTYDYDTNGNLITVHQQPNDPSTDVQSTLHFVREPQRGQVVQQTVEAPGVAPRTTNYYYDKDDVFVTQVINAMGHVSSVLMHAGFGEPLLVQDANGVTSTSKYDGFGRLLSVDSPTDMDLSVSYGVNIDKAGMPIGLTISQMTTDGSQNTVLGDEDGRATKSMATGFHGENLYTATYYNLYGHPVMQRLPGSGVPSANRILATYDTLGRIRSTTAPDNVKTTYNYLPHQQSTIDGKYHERRVYFDAQYRPERTEEELEQAGLPKTLTTNYHYGAFDTLLDTTFNGQAIAMQYDSLGRKIWMDDPDAGKQQFFYDGLGQIRHHITANGNTLTSNYDLLGRLTDFTDSDGTTMYGWDAAKHGIGELALAQSPDGVKTGIKYDDLGRPTHTDWTISHPNEPDAIYAVDQSYDALGRLQQIGYPADPSGERFAIEFAYNASGFRESVSRTVLGNPGTFAPVWKALDRDTNLALTRSEFGNGLQTSFQYDPINGLLKHVRTDYPLVQVGATPKFGVDYDHDDLRNVITREWPAQGVKESYQFDTLNRLKHWDVEGVPDTGGREFFYDDAGNLESIWLKNAQNPNGVTEYNANYGANGHPNALATSSTVSMTAYDLAGNQTLANTRIVTYTDANLPRRVSNNAKVTWMKYGPGGTRVEKCGPVSGFVNCSPDTPRTTYIGGLYERRQNGATTEDVFYVPGGNGIAAQVIRAATPGASNSHVIEDIRYLEHDHLGSSSVAFDDAGSAETQLFDPWGKSILHTGGSMFGSLLTFGYTDQEHEPELDWVNMNGRMYDPAQRRMIETDPLIGDALFSQGRNRYSYVLNNPIRYSDPSGFEAEATGGTVTHSDGTSEPIGGGVIRVPMADIIKLVRDHNRFLESCQGPCRNPTPVPGEMHLEYRFETPAVIHHDFDDLDSDIHRQEETRLSYAYQSRYQDSRENYQKAIGDTVTPNPVAAAVQIVHGIDGLNHLTDPAYNSPSSQATVEDVVNVAALGVAAALAGESSKENCFVAGTLVQTPDGAKVIESLRVGDQVIAGDERTGGTENKTVLETYHNQGKATLKVTLGDENGTKEQIGVTTEHPFHVAGGWVAADKLHVGDRVDRQSKGPLVVEGIERDQELHDTYNFKVADLHTYFVGKLGAWVHNQSYLDMGGGKEQRIGIIRIGNDGSSAVRVASRLMFEDGDHGSLSRAMGPRAPATLVDGDIVPGDRQFAMAFDDFFKDKWFVQEGTGGCRMPTPGDVPQITAVLKGTPLWKGPHEIHVKVGDTGMKANWVRIK